MIRYRLACDRPAACLRHQVQDSLAIFRFARMVLELDGDARCFLGHGFNGFCLPHFTAVMRCDREIIKMRGDVASSCCAISWELPNGKLRSTTAITSQRPLATAAPLQLFAKLRRRTSHDLIGNSRGSWVRGTD